MKEIRLLQTSQIRLFPQDAIPVLKLLLEENRESIKTLYKFQNVEPVAQREAVTGLSFSTGTYGSPSTLIEAVTIELRRIVVRVMGNSEAAQSVYEGVRQKLQELNDGQPIKEILCTHETACSVVLDVPFERLFSRSFLSFLDKSASKYTKNKWGRNIIMPTTLKFSVRYMVTDEKLLKNHITLAPKELTIEPRVQSSPEERLYWIASPTDSDTHLKLVKDLERALLARNLD